MVGVAIRNTRGRPSLASSKKLSYSTILNIVIAVTTYFLGYLTGISKTISHKANCVQVISSLLRKGEHDTLSADETRQMEDTIKSVVEERMAKGKLLLAFFSFLHVTHGNSFEKYSDIE